MKISLRWLSDYIQVSEFFQAPEKLSELLTRAGLEVENFTDLSKPFRNVVIGHILKKEQHPNADRLTLCQVTTGGGVIHQIVCGAKNHSEGDIVVVALPGAILPGEFEIRRSSIRGVDSGGMLCSESELGLAEKAEGILLLPKDAPIGESFAKYWGKEDIVFDLKVTPNRADCLSHWGLSRELAALGVGELKPPATTYAPTNASSKDFISVQVKATEACPRYAGGMVANIKIGPSPAWMKARLESVGMKSINNVVDVTNYVMMDLGQPLHAFDSRQLKGGQIIVDFAEPGETFQSFDGTEFKLDGTELTIRDSERCLALAGIVGGKNSGVENDTQQIFVESAYFNPAQVRRTSRKFGIETDSCYRFSRGVDPEACFLALERAFHLLAQCASGTPYSHSHDVQAQKEKRTDIHLKLDQLSDRLGRAVPQDTVSGILKRLGASVEAVAEKSAFVVRAPSYRHDLKEPVDLIEEVARVTGYEAIGETLPLIRTAPTPHSSEFLLGRKVGRLLRAQGLQEALNFGFVHSSWQETVLGPREVYQRAGLPIAGAPVKIVNPLNEELDVMRLSLLPWLVKNLIHNVRHGNEFGRVFERGPCFEKGKDTYTETQRLGFTFWGDKSALWESAKAAPLVLQLKSHIEGLLSQMGIRGFSWSQKEGYPGLAHPKQWAVLTVKTASGENAVGWIGAMSPLLTEEYKIRVPVAVGELDLARLSQFVGQAFKTTSIGKFPMVERDLAFVMPKAMESAKVTDSIKSVAGEWLKSVQVFDVFEGGNLKADQKSIAFKMRFQSMTETLTDEQLTALQAKIILAVQESLKISVR
ncbi:MAG: phenylalanine--tRNA ligase subunit beta [Bdellovibrionales bacterium]|nr:phenylalanine--tRNA ligase subunit beta [Bdellovibrionales bacterium]